MHASTKPRQIKLLKQTSSKEKVIAAYTITDKKTGAVYHGSSKNLHRRIAEHEGDLRRNEHGNHKLQNIALKGGDLVLEYYPTATAEDALKLEQKLIDSTPAAILLNASLDSASFVKGMWKNPEIREKISKARLNNTHAAGHKHTDQWKQAQSERLKGNQNRLGHKHDDASKVKMAAARVGRKPTQEAILAAAKGRTKNAVVISGVEYMNAAAAAKAIGITYSGINRRCNSVNFPEYQLKPVNRNL